MADVVRLKLLKRRDSSSVFPVPVKVDDLQLGLIILHFLGGPLVPFGLMKTSLGISPKENTPALYPVALLLTWTGEITRL